MYRIGMTEPEVEVFFKMFDRDNSGTIEFEEFIRGSIVYDI